MSRDRDRLREEALGKFPLTYELTVFRESATVYRTMARGILGDVLRDAYHLGAALTGDRLTYVRQAQRVPPAPDGTTFAWYVGEQIPRGATMELRIDEHSYGSSPHALSASA